MNASRVHKARKKCRITFPAVHKTTMSKRPPSPPRSDKPRTRTRYIDENEEDNEEEFELERPARNVIDLDEEEEDLPASSASSALIARHQAEHAARERPTGVYPLVAVRPVQGISHQTRYNPMNDETVLTAFLLFGIFLDAKWPIELVCFLFDWIQKVFRAKEGLQLHFRTDSAAASNAPILYVNPKLSAFPRIINPSTTYSTVGSFDFCYTKSIKNLTFFDYISGVAKNIVALYFANTLSQEIGKEFFERVHRCCISAYPDCPYYFSSMMPDLKSSAACATTVPRVHFYLIDGKRNKHSFNFCPLLFPNHVKKVFITVVIKPPKHFKRLISSQNGDCLEDGYYDNECSAAEKAKMVKLGCTEFSDRPSEEVAPGVMGIFVEPEKISTTPDLNKEGKVDPEALGLRTEDGLRDLDGRCRMKFFIPGTDSFTFVTGDTD